MRNIEITLRGIPPVAALKVAMPIDLLSQRGGTGSQYIESMLADQVRRLDGRLEFLRGMPFIKIPEREGILLPCR